MDSLEQDLERISEGYRQALARALERVPVRNGVVSIRDLWLETALPLDLIAELLQTDGIPLPPHVTRVDLRSPLRKEGHVRKR